MIDAKDIRIGNKFIYNGKIITVLTIEFDEPISHRKAEVDKYVIKFEDDYCSVESLNPIPLTPKILEQCGFEYIDKWIANKKTNSTYYGYYWLNEYCIKIEGSYPLGRAFSKVNPNIDININTEDFIANNIKYLHQLQNLFYALTGTELTVNL